MSNTAAFLHALQPKRLGRTGFTERLSGREIAHRQRRSWEVVFQWRCGGCNNCHSPTGDGYKVASNCSPMDPRSPYAQYPEGRHTTAVADVCPSGEIRSRVRWRTSTILRLRCATVQRSWYRSFSRDRVKVEIQDPPGGSP